MLFLPILSALLPAAIAAPHVARNNTGATPTSSAPQVTITPAGTNGQGVTITGVRQAQFGQDLYLGVPFAAPPVGELRFKPPQDPVYNSTLSAVRQPPACLQNPGNNATYGQYGFSEDCLYLNVYTPQGANAQNSYLPVMLWIYGGSFTSGSANFYNASALMYQGIATKRPFIFVAINYRLGVLGWPYGAEAAKNGAANLGLKDARKALSWVQDNIWAFGGNPDQVTVFGESAGAIATSLLYLQQDSSSLFSGAIMESGAMSVSPIGPTATTWNNAYNDLVKAANCSAAANSTGGTWGCLKTLPAAQLISAQVQVTTSLQYGAAFPFAPSIDGDLIPDSPHKLISEGRFQQIPFISGNNKDEGTVFVPRSLASESLLSISLNLFEPKPLSNNTIAELFQYYPNEPARGSPFNTGNNTFGLSPVYKQAAAILGDATFQAGRRWFMQNAGKIYPNLPTWSYFFNQSFPGAPDYLGVYHGSEVYYVFGVPQFGPSVYGNFTQQDAVVSKTMVDYWLNFAYYRDPAPASSPVANQTAWPQYDSAGGKKNMLQIQFGNVSLIRDDYREESIAFFNRNPQQFNLKRFHNEE